MHSWLLTVGLVLSCAVSACGGGAPPGADGAAGAGAFPPVDVKTDHARGEAGSAVVRIRRDDPVAALDDGPAAGRRLRPADPRPRRRPRDRGPADGPDRSRPAAGHGECHRVAARRARGGPRARDAAARARTQAARGGRRQPRGARRGRDRAQERDGAARRRPVADSREPGASCSTTASPRRPPASSATSRSGQGDRVTPATVDHDDRSARRARGLRQRAARARRRI